MDIHRIDIPTPNASSMRSFAELEKWRTEGVDYTVTVTHRARSRVAVVAPHGGSIEQYTSDVAALIAGDNFNLYLLDGKMRSGNYAALHLTSHHFDEPRCLKLQSQCDYSVAIHGCAGDGIFALVGGLDEPLKVKIVEAIVARGIDCAIDNAKFPAREPLNICNRNRRSAGSQIELSLGLRNSKGHREALALIVRELLLNLDDAAA